MLILIENVFIPKILLYLMMLSKIVVCIRHMIVMDLKRKLKDKSNLNQDINYDPKIFDLSKIQTLQ